MTERNFLDKRKNAMEEEYFRKQEKELVEKMQLDKTQESARLEMASTLGIADSDIVRALQALGYTPATISLLYLVPLIQVAWAEGSVSKHERTLILEAAGARGIEFGSSAYECLSEWLNVRPMEAFFERTLHVIRALLQILPLEQRETVKRDLVSYCTKVAEVSGGFIGFLGSSRRVCTEERELLARIVTELDLSHQALA
jgi:hypothetical protein